MFSDASHRELIDKYAKEGWKYINSIPTSFYGNNGQPKTFDLIFEKSDDEQSSYQKNYIVITLI